MFEVLAVEQVFAAYGLTESTGICTITGAGDPIETIALTSARVDNVQLHARNGPAGCEGDCFDRVTGAGNRAYACRLRQPIGREYLFHREHFEHIADKRGSYRCGAGDGDPQGRETPLFGTGLGHQSVTAACTALPFATLDLDRLTSAIDDDGVTVLQGPPTMFHGLVAKARAEKRRFPTLRVAVTGAASIAPTLVRDMFEVLGVEQVFAAYGLTESTGICTITGAGDPIETIALTSGRPIPGMQLDIVDPGGRSTPTGVSGEILVRGINRDGGLSR